MPWIFSYCRRLLGPAGVEARLSPPRLGGNPQKLLQMGWPIFSYQEADLLSKPPYTEHPPFAPTGWEGAIYRVPLVCRLGGTKQRALPYKSSIPSSFFLLFARSQVGPCQFLIYRFWGPHNPKDPNSKHPPFSPAFSSADLSAILFLVFFKASWASVASFWAPVLSHNLSQIWPS